MLKVKQLDQSTYYKNSSDEEGFVGARVEGENLVSAVSFSAPIPNDTLGRKVKFLVKLYVPEDTDGSNADVSTALTKCESYHTANTLGLNLAGIAEGPIDLTIADIA